MSRIEELMDQASFLNDQKPLVSKEPDEDYGLSEQGRFIIKTKTTTPEIKPESESTVPPRKYFPKKHREIFD